MRVPAFLLSRELPESLWGSVGPGWPKQIATSVAGSCYLRTSECPGRGTCGRDPHSSLTFSPWGLAPYGLQDNEWERRKGCQELVERLVSVISFQMSPSVPFVFMSSFWALTLPFSTATPSSAMHGGRAGHLLSFSHYFLPPLMSLKFTWPRSH